MSPCLSPLEITSGSHIPQSILIPDSSLETLIEEKYNPADNRLSGLLQGTQNIMLNSSISTYSNVGTESSNIEPTSYKNVQPSNNLIFGTEPFNPPSVSWNSWGTPNLHPITPPISVHPSQGARRAFFRQDYPGRFAEGEMSATTYNIG